MYRCDSLIFYMHLVFITTVPNQYMEEGERVSDANGFEWVWFLLTQLGQRLQALIVRMP